MRMSIGRKGPAFLLFMALLSVSPEARPARVSLSNAALRVAIARDGTYEIMAAGLERPVLRAQIASEINHRWVQSSDYPRHSVTTAAFRNTLGRGRLVTISFTGLTSKPDLRYTLRVFDGLPFGELEADVRNTTPKTVTVQAIRLAETTGASQMNLGGPPAADRVLSDSFSEDDPVLKIRDLGAVPAGLHRAVGSQLVFNRQSKESFFLGALTTRRFLTIIRLQALNSFTPDVQIGTYTVDSTGTTEVQRAGPLSDAPATSLMALSLAIEPGEQLSSERVMFAAGNDYYEQLEEYGKAIRVLHRARVLAKAPMGWWSWTAFYSAINQDAALRNAQWLAEHLKRWGFVYFHLDEGYDYARGDYTTPDARKFPNGMGWLGGRIAQLGLKLGVWTAPFEVSARAWVYQHHPDWLVRNQRGEPLQVGGFKTGQSPTYVLDETNPAAQTYLRQTYRTMTHEWGARYIKLDFMETTAVEGRYYRPNTTAVEAERMGLGVIRDAVGDGVLLDKDGSPMLVPVGLVDAGRISVDTGHSFWASKDAAPGIAARYYMNGNFFVSDPDAFTVSRQSIYDHSWPDSTKPLTLEEAQVSVVLAALAGGMYEIGDDLPTLGADPDRVALAENGDLLDMVRCRRAALPLDLMSYRPQDEQPSVFLLRENQHQTMLAVFNWTKEPRSHVFTSADLGLPSGRAYRACDVLDREKPLALENGVLMLNDQAPDSVRLIKLVDVSAGCRTNPWSGRTHKSR
jgi:alpha-galactosidase